ncbi:hypothetical protein [Microbispora sp. NPDC049125]|uniref:hypothetical protein n=1 Tax=Microbispora sp. NPDC049125 TaxID=3154929 RepID=UPI0034663638
MSFRLLAEERHRDNRVVFCNRFEKAARVLAQETGLRAELFPVPAAVSVRSYRADWSPTLGLSYMAITDRDVPFRGQTGQPPKWFELCDEWERVFPEDRDRIQVYVRHLPAERSEQADDVVPRTKEFTACRNMRDRNRRASPSHPRSRLRTGTAPIPGAVSTRSPRAK